MANNAQVAKELSVWQTTVEQYWPQVHFGEVMVERRKDGWEFKTQVYFGELDPAFVRVEIYADPLGDADVLCQEMTRGGRLPGTVNGYTFRALVMSPRPSDHFSLRVVPAHPEAVVPLENQLILWQH